jgi:hypothetical protein
MHRGLASSDLQLNFLMSKCQKLGQIYINSVHKCFREIRMQISRIAIATLFAAGLIAAPVSVGFASEKPEVAAECVEGYITIYNEDGTISCEVETVPFTVDDIKPIDACWTTEDGLDVCARGGIAPLPATGEEVAPDSNTADGIEPISSCWVNEDGVDVCARDAMVPTPAKGEEVPPLPADTSGCFISSETEDGGWMACADSSPLDGAAEEPGGVRFYKDGQEDGSLLMQSGVAKSAEKPDQTASNTLAAFGVLVAALGAFGIGISRQKESE